MMKKIFLLLMAITALAGINAQTLFTYGNNTVSKDEFVRAYNKNKTPVADKEQSLKEYLELYIRFKLKVKEASLQKLDTLQQIQYDIQNFRNQLEENYLTDEKTVNNMVAEAFIRSQKDIHVLHFQVPFNERMNEGDAAKANKAINLVRESLLNGQTNYDALVDDISEKVTKTKGTDLGYITCFSLPYSIENMLYALPAGAVTAVYKTKSALHVFKNEGERPSAGRWKIAQVLLAIPPDVTGAQLKVIEKRADSIYQQLQAGANFTELAKKYSDDRLTYMNGGELPEFGTGKYDLPFEKAVFALQKDGDISKPIYTGYGYHIVKRLQHTPTPTDKNNEEYLAQLKQQVQQDARMSIAKNNFIKDISTKTGFKRNTLVKDELLFKYADSVAASGIVKKFPISNKPLFSFPQSTVTGGNWLQFVNDYKLNPDVYKGESNAALLEKYSHTVITEYYRKHLHQYNPDFKYQLQEFKEGNMLFEIMERNIWSKAAADTNGLKKFYEANQAKYSWAESASACLFNCSNLQTAQAAASNIKNGKNWHTLVEESGGSILADSGRYELAQLQIPTGTILKEGTVTNALLNAGDNTAGFVHILKLYPANQPRSFEEARGLVINEYQTYLEEKWVEMLKKKYPVKVNEAVFKTLLP
ncbi:MAG: hypothetical protein RL172_3211 [Bacteroidota bacterium]